MTQSQLDVEGYKLMHLFDSKAAMRVQNVALLPEHLTSTSTSTKTSESSSKTPLPTPTPTTSTPVESTPRISTPKLPSTSSSSSSYCCQVQTAASRS
jgi:hypothetical protein